MPDEDAPPRKDLTTAPDDPPVVMRLVIEIRSDGTRTIARGAAEDVASGERVAIEAAGGSPIELAFSLAKSMFSLPALALRKITGALPSVTDKKRK
jgi:hypothetical protein